MASDKTKVPGLLGLMAAPLSGPLLGKKPDFIPYRGESVSGKGTKKEKERQQIPGLLNIAASPFLGSSAFSSGQIDSLSKRRYTKKQKF